jgi:hypothetical protein
VVTRPGDHRRIWYVTIDGREDPAMKAAVLEKRAPGEYVGPWHFLIRLYEAPPDVQGVLYENGMRFHGAEIVNGASPGYPVYREAETVRLKMWWSVDDGSPVTLDYSITTQVPSRDGTSLIAQVDGPPQVGPELPAETSRWTPGQFYVEEREFALPEPLLTGVYRVNMAVYWWQDQKRLNAPGVNADGMREIAIFRVKSW